VTVRHTRSPKEINPRQQKRIATRGDQRPPAPGVVLRWKAIYSVGERVNYYATVPAPPTIAELVDRLEKKFGIDLPLVDLFYWDTPRFHSRSS